VTPLLVITGPPGAGKSAVARNVANRFDPSALVEGDVFFSFLARGAIPPWLPESYAQNEVVTQAAAVAAGRYASGGYTTVYDGVVGPWFLSAFVNASRLASIDYVLLLPDVERCVERVATRVGHGFTDEDATRKMHHEFACAEIDQRHLIIDLPDPVEEVADLIVEAWKRGTLVHQSRS
jgi:gluconate kinase